ncbi:hypothetical protein B0T25DRAFT_333679 [Lasiosphaeria hispida]|uniref:Basic proline-rich protein n=1 Tax=Lasiosphaeria hispida TaxID=260671 RepID=A0AAJ0M824_9PEZI|nr:hypothetical protein B0T25DRAFT_333679 [Lasiosphaeria hispida]
MEPVPETERMEEFRPSPLPSLRVQGSSALSPHDLDFLRKPPTLRRSTDPSPASSPTSPSWTPPNSLPFRPRAASPLSSSHVRSRSAASLAPPMARTQSMPGVNAAGHLMYSPQLRAQSPSGSPSRVRAQRKPVDEAFPPPSPTRVSVHDGERKLSERSSAPNLGLGFPSVTTASRLMRPASPLRNVTHSGNGLLSASPMTPSSASTSPSYRSYDSFPSNYSFGIGYPSSSVPSTPTSARSRSPSISSLETIPDSPDAEEAALEAERIAQLKADADAAEGGDAKGRGSLDVPIRGRTLGFGSRDKRKRWSVCGAERRQDLDLETIWED